MTNMDNMHPQPDKYLHLLGSKPGTVVLSKD